MDGTVLLADDDRTIRTVLTQALSRAGCKVHATGTLSTLMRWVEEGRGDVVISDVVMPDGNGLETLKKIRAMRPDLPVIIISAQNTILTAVRSAEGEAFDYLPKPFDLPDLMQRCARGLEHKRRVPRALAHDAANNGESAAHDAPREMPLLGRTPLMQELYRVIARVMNGPLPVMIEGESGTGKSLIARAIHDMSARRARPFVTLGLAEIGAKDVHEQVARAASGTLLIEALADFDAAAQLRLLHILERRSSASGEEGAAPALLMTCQSALEPLSAAGVFRKDLFYRLSGVTLHVPPLRARRGDIALLADHFLAQAAGEFGGVKSLDEPAYDVLRGQEWPGNLRQLEMLMRRLALTSPAARITSDEVHEALGGASEAPLLAARAPQLAQMGADTGVETLSSSISRHVQRYFSLHGDDLPPAGIYPRLLREMEAPLIEIALEAVGGNQVKCADLLGMNRNTLRKKITELDLRVTRRRKLM